MTTKQFKGKAIYNPSGKAGEYSYWACNFYNGCSNNCDYCYCKRGVMASTWSEKPYLKKCFRDEVHALKVFEKEMMQNLTELQNHGLFYSFTTDPCLEKTINLTYQSMRICLDFNIPVKILTKRADWIHGYMIRNGNKFIDFPENIPMCKRDKIMFMFTLTGHDDIETGASANSERINSMQILKKMGFWTGSSIEPIITFPASLEMIERTVDYCDLYKIGLKSGMKCDPEMLNRFINAVIYSTESMGCKVYFKDGLIQQAGISRDQLPANCVGRDYNIFK